SIYKGFVFSQDKRHLLVTARPNSSGSNTASAREISELLADVAKELKKKHSPMGIMPEITPVGAYRAALDNERIIRHDVNLALLLSTAGIGLLLFVAFPRPLLGIFSLLPAVAGTATALFLFSLFHQSISIMVLGFGGALISITVDHGIAYLLFLDRPEKTKGKEASGEVRAIGLLAVLTTCGAFLTLSFSGFPIFVQLGQFTAMGVLFSFLFVHFIFPHITPSMPPSSRQNLPLQGLVDRLYSTGRPGAIAAVILAGSLLFFARPEFNVSLESMNTVSQETLAADSLFSKVWGKIDTKIVLMSTGQAADLQNTNDNILKHLEEEQRNGKIASAFVPSMIFPGAELATSNLNAWKNFWTEKRREDLRKKLNISGKEIGFAEDAFAQFIQSTHNTEDISSIQIPTKFYKLLGISEKDDQLTQFINITPGENYNSDLFYKSYTQYGKIFDGPYFSK
ncbi:MAG: MMPL family transporter, partial [Desulfocapsa sp.]|nr:MMPL family transporter [Desulfocapsa sp.]